MQLEDEFLLGSFITEMFIKNDFCDMIWNAKVVNRSSKHNPGSQLNGFEPAPRQRIAIDLIVERLLQNLKKLDAGDVMQNV